MKKSLMLMLLIVLFTSSFVFAQSTLSEPSYCCEKTTSGAYCQNAPEDQCNLNYRTSATSCETTSYCKLGTCYDSEEGICMENTPQVVCNEQGGTWDPREKEDIAQCQLGCCVMADQAAFVSLVRCKRLSSFFGIENNYDSSITSEIACIATAQSQDMGACIYEEDFELRCEFTTRGDCGAEEGVINENAEAASELDYEGPKFYKDMLCSAEELNTNCAKQASTTCHNGEVYWVDSCGNRENVYSSNRQRSWNGGRVADAEEVCDPNDGSDINCGNCDYFQGTRCEAWSGVLGVGKPDGADHFCQKTECVDRYGTERINGESWCTYDSPVGGGIDKAGSRHYREICIDGEVIVEPCADFRNEICLASSITVADGGQFGTAACRVNRWRDCVLQTEADDCLNVDRRDCMWVDPVFGMVLGDDSEEGEGSSGGSNSVAYSNPTANFNNAAAGPTVVDGETISDQFSNPTGAVIAPITGNAIVGEGDERQTVSNREDGICVPSFAPGIDFWGGNPDVSDTCGLASAECAVVYEEGLLGGRDLVAGGECLEEAWAVQSNQVCTALGDCGGYVNFVDIYTDDGYNWNQEGYGDESGKREFSPSAVNRIKGGFSGMVIRALEGENV